MTTLLVITVFAPPGERDGRCGVFDDFEDLRGRHFEQRHDDSGLGRAVEGGDGFDENSDLAVMHSQCVIVAGGHGPHDALHVSLPRCEKSREEHGSVVSGCVGILAEVGDGDGFEAEELGGGRSAASADACVRSAVLRVPGDGLIGPCFEAECREAGDISQCHDEGLRLGHDVLNCRLYQAEICSGVGAEPTPEGALTYRQRSTGRRLDRCSDSQLLTVLRKRKEMSLHHERRAAIDAVLKACALCREVQSTLVSDETIAKKDKSPVTVADFGAQALVISSLRRHFPDIPMVGEEDARTLRSDEGRDLCDKVLGAVKRLDPAFERDAMLDAIDAGTFEGGAKGRHWTLDPIDGTKGFLRGEQYAVALALIEDGKVILGVLGCPNLPHDASNPEGPAGCVFIAEKGKGATVRTLNSPTESPVHVTDIVDPSEATFCESVESAHSNQSDSAQVAQLLGITRDPYRIDSQCKYAAVARGDASIYLRLPTKKGYEEKIWDHAAGSIVITEAGGRVTDVRGDDLDFSIGRTLRDNLGVIVTNGHLHERVVHAVGEVLDLAPSSAS